MNILKKKDFLTTDILFRKSKKTLYRKKEEYIDFVLYKTKKLKLLTLWAVSTIERNGSGSRRPSCVSIFLLKPKFITKFGKRSFSPPLKEYRLLEKFFSELTLLTFLKFVIVPGTQRYIKRQKAQLE